MKKNILILLIIGIIVIIGTSIINWYFTIALLCIAFFTWIVLLVTDGGDSSDVSIYTGSHTKQALPRTPFEFYSSTHYTQRKAQHIAHSIKEFVEALIVNKRGLIGSSELVSFWGIDRSSYKTLHKRHLDNIITGLHSLGYGVVPNYQQGHKRLDYNELCVIYKLPSSTISSESTNLHNTEIFLRLFAILIDGKPTPSDIDCVNKFLGELNAPNDSLNYLKAYTLWMMQKKQPYDRKTKDEVSLLSKECKVQFAKMLMEAITIYGKVDKSRALNYIKIALTLDDSYVNAVLHHEGFATVERGVRSTEYKIRGPQHKEKERQEERTGSIVLDQKKLDDLRQQTQLAQSLLSDIFTEEVEVQTTREDSKDDSIRDILNKLLEKDVWQRDEVTNMLGAGVMLGNILEQINDYAYSIVDDIVVEEDGDTIYVTTEYKEQLNYEQTNQG